MVVNGKWFHVADVKFEFVSYHVKIQGVTFKMQRVRIDFLPSAKEKRRFLLGGDLHSILFSLTTIGMF